MADVLSLISADTDTMPIISCNSRLDSKIFRLQQMSVK